MEHVGHLSPPRIRFLCQGKDDSKDSVELETCK